MALSTPGPDATSLVTAATYTQLGAMPMLMITGQKPIRLHKQGLFQLMDVVDMMQPLTKHTRQLVFPATIPAQIREAFRPSPDDAALVQAGEAISQAKHPILMIGAAASPQRTAVALRAFIDKLGIPFFTTQMTKAWWTRTIRCGWATPLCPTATSCTARSTTACCAWTTTCTNCGTRATTARQPNTILLDNALTTMGAGLPSTTAAKLVHPHRKVLTICGDGGFMMNAQELETTAWLELDLVIPLLRDDAYGMIRWKQADIVFVLAIRAQREAGFTH